jgi:N-acetylglucosaminyldiphosphoundecaprenol N-acetyl-beta-D-mannosaminyltransferase
MHFLSLSIIHSTYQDFLSRISDPEKKTLVFTPNPEILVRALTDRVFLDILKQANYLTPDAHGLYTASLIQEGSGFFMAGIRTFFQKKSLAKKYGELISGSSLTRDLVDIAIRAEKRVLMIDNYRITEPANAFEEKKMEVQRRLPELFAQRFPDLDIDIVLDGEKSPEELAELIQSQNISYVFSCIGMKTQEERLIEIFSHLPDAQQVVGLGVGSSFDYLLGLQTRAPVFLQKLGLEWLYRLIRSPSRFRRIYTALVEFPRMVRCFPILRFQSFVQEIDLAHFADQDRA